jgi:hypothetical protein
MRKYVCSCANTVQIVSVLAHFRVSAHVGAEKYVLCACVYTHCLRINYYVQKIGGPRSFIPNWCTAKNPPSHSLKIRFSALYLIFINWFQ